MLSALELSGLFSAEDRAPEDYSRWRPRFYGLVDPVDFLLTSVDDARSKGAGFGFDEQDPDHALHWLGRARDIYGSSGGDLSQMAQRELVELFVKALGCPLNSRERSQICYLLRALGCTSGFSAKGKGLFESSGAGGPPVVFSALLEFDAGQGPTLVYGGADRFAAAYWDGGSVKLPPYEATGATEFLLKAVSAASSLLDRLDLQSDSYDLPDIPAAGNVFLSVVTDRGVFSKTLPVSSVLSTGLTSLYNPLVGLLRVLVSDQGPGQGQGRDAGSLSPVALRVFGEEPRAFVPEDPDWKYPTIFKRVGAFLIDGVFYVALFSVLSYFLWPAFDGWSYLVSLLAKVWLIMLFPLLAAWMESSSDWGYASMGKQLLRIRVVSMFTSKGPLFLQALARNLAKWYLSPLFLGTGFLWAFFHPLRRTWHDLLADTVVVYKPEGANDDLDALPEIVVQPGQAGGDGNPRSVRILPPEVSFSGLGSGFGRGSGRSAGGGDG